MKEWISVKDRLPEAGVRVLFFERGMISIGFKNDADPESNWWCDCMNRDRDGDYLDCWETTYWMPLPEPPQ